ncbi:hypothetical protein FDI59_gp035 [Mycobacterium phage Yoshi]|uniref:Uncharacterized protein n=1 Tax=Mycobacterium phage Yoshi TaxID=2920891 RepID=G1BSE2_9CAUD|nr:hypothetical protein FDI59_gp035 [Mycobacterium phage Yoshi]AEK07786.1 hypothetical protein YOSHI_35 [Mycobacterium phage Yoshi]
MDQQKSRVCRSRRKDGSLYVYPIWDVYDSSGEWSGAFDTWPEAMDWATSIATRIEYWLSRQQSRS